MSNSKDLFDESSMSFGEHLEILRVHLIRAIFGLLLGLIVALLCGNRIVAVISDPIHAALAEHGIKSESIKDKNSFFERAWSYCKSIWTGEESKKENPEKPKTADNKSDTKSADNKVKEKTETTKPASSDPELAAVIAALDKFDKRLQAIEAQVAANSKQAQTNRTDLRKPVVLNVQEAFLTYLKVSLVAGFVFTSPWIFYQFWLFVSAGLYQHERKYVYLYMPISLSLFLGGAIFCFYGVLPLVLKFLLGFAVDLHVQPNIRLSEWISFAIMLPVMFGLSFQLPLVMLLLERISIFEISVYQEKRRMAILVIAIISMFMTPADPASMIMMMIPLVLLYELGIWMCKLSKSKSSPFEAGHAT